MQALIKQGMELQQNGQLERAKQHYQEILESNQHHPDALHLYGLACHQQGDHETAIEYIKRAIDQVPSQPVLRNNLADAMRNAGQLTEALVQLKLAIEMRPDYAGAQQNLGSVYAQLGDHDAALHHARLATEMDGRRPEAWLNLGLILLDQILLEDAVEAFRYALELRPNYPRAANSLLYVLNLLPNADPDEVAQEHHQVVSKLVTHITPDKSSTDRSGRIRVGYLSADFCNHALNYFFEPVLEHQDSNRFEIFCYSAVSNPDDTTRRLKDLAEHWRNINGQDDETVFEKIKADSIDILVDLVGHTRGNRLGVFAQRAAACQLSWLGYPNTTGLDSMDYRLVDQYTVEQDDDTLSTEQLVRLRSGFACFRPPTWAPEVRSAPMQRNGYVTLASLHKLEKLNPSVIALWARVLLSTPDSKLMLVRDQLDGWHQNRLTAEFSKYGIDSDRLEMIQYCASQQSFFDIFADVDVLLDSFPWSGHTLACCALWMGVPVVTLKGNTHAGRMVSSVLNLLGLDELIANDANSYLQICTDLCTNQERLTAYRAGLRKRFKQSPLRDEYGFTRAMETEFERIISF
jgi:protein O-GlcNAc transferase